MNIVNSVLGDATGGRWQVVLDYTRVLTGIGHKVLLLVNSRTVNNALDLPAGVELVKVRNSGHYDPLATLVVWKVLRRFRPDASIAHCSRSLAVLNRAVGGKVPIIAVCHSTKVTRMIKAYAHFNVSAHIGDMLVPLTPPGHPSYLLPNMIQFDPEVEFAPREHRQPPVIGSLARFDKIKGVDVLLRALNRLQERGVDFRCRIGGAGVQEQELKGLADELGLAPRVQFVGWVDNREAFFGGIDVFCSASRSEAFGITPVEAAIAGVPLVLSRAEGHCCIFEEGKHALFAAIDSIDELADALESMLVSPQQGHVMAESAFYRVKENYSETVFSGNLKYALNDVVTRYYGKK